VRCLLALVLLGAALTGCGSAAPVEPLSAAPTFSVSTTAPALPKPQPRPVEVAVAARSISGPVLVDGLGLDKNGGHVEPTVEKPKLASWYNLGPIPGELGPAVILGHVNGGGQPGIFANLDRVVIGDVITVTREDKSRITFRVYRRELKVKTDFPTNEVYGDTAGSELRLITCGGQLDRVNHRYLSNVIVWARLVDNVRS
jgi:hypothetical protein